MPQQDPMQTVDPAEEVQHAIDARYGVVDLFRAMIADLEARWRAARAGESHEAEPVAGPEAELGAIVDRLDERAFGLLLLLLCLPCIPPFVYVLPQIVSVPMLALALQMAAGRQSPWLPDKLRARRFALGEFSKVLDWCEKYIRWVEAIARPRLPAVTERLGVRIVGALLVIPSLSIMLPLIGTNTVPGIGAAIAALGLVQRDGVLVVLGLAISLVWVTLLVVFALFFGVEFAAFLKEWAGSLL